MIEKTVHCPHCGEANTVNNRETLCFFECKKCGEINSTPDSLPEKDYRLEK